MADGKRSESITRQRAASVKGKEKEEWKCKLCEEIFKDEKAELMECEYCEEHFCKKCLHMSVSEYKVLSKRKDIHWYCPPCETKAMKNLKIEKEIEERCKDYFEKFEKKLSDLEKKVDGKPDRKEVEDMIKESESRAEKGAASGPSVDEQLAEMRESESKRNNVIIHSLVEPGDSEAENRKLVDNAALEELCEVLETNYAEIKKSYRLGKRNERTEASKPRPLKIEFKGIEAKEDFMKNARKLAKVSGKFANISIAHDMTRKEREENKRKVQEARDKNEKEESKNHRHIVVGPAWDRKVIRVKKKEK